MGSPGIEAIFVQRVVVGVGDMAVSNNTQIVISTYALGSCVGVVAYAPTFRIGGILHLMLPESRISAAKAATQPAMFADTGLPRFFREMAALGASDGELQLFVAGGASVMGGTDPFRIGERNLTATLDYLSRHRMRLRGEDMHGTVNRTLHLEMQTGNLTIRTPMGQSEISLAWPPG